MIIIVTNKMDITTDLVILQLQAQKCDYIRFNTEDFLQKNMIFLKINDQENIVNLGTLNRQFNITSISSVWYRRPIRPIPHQLIDNEQAGIFAVQESERVIHNLWKMLDNALWVSKPEYIREAEYKLYQLQIASRIGLNIPSTIVTTDPTEAKLFCSMHKSVISKPIYRGVIKDDRFPTKCIYTNLLSEEDKNDLTSVIVCPTLFQQYIVKKFDLRVTVVGRKVFATEIYAGGESQNIIDWRRENIDQVEHREHQLPIAIEHKIIALMRYYKLQFAALDFIVTPDNDYVFLEINPNGQWAWIEQMIGTPISFAIVDLLMHRVQPL